MRVWLSYAFVLVVEVAKSRAGGVSVVARAVVSPANYPLPLHDLTGAQLARGRAARGSVGSRDGDYPEMMAGKRHHHLPAFLLRRFAERSGKREGQVWRLDKDTGQPRPVDPKREGALRHYYSLELPDGTKDTSPEDAIQAVENKTAKALHAIARGETPSDEDRAWLALFVVFQHKRTPVGRSWLRFYDEKAAEMTTEASLSNAESFRERARAADSDLTLEEIEEVRLEMLEDFKAGRISIESIPSREVAAMFLNADTRRRRSGQKLHMGRR